MIIKPFSSSDYCQVTIPEDAAIESLVTKVTATDRDKDCGNNITYFIKSGSNLPFKIDKTSGQLLLRAPGVDFEEESIYSFKVVAQDNGAPNRKSSTDVTVNISDVNDNAPSLLADSIDDNIDVECSLSNCTIYVHESDSKRIVTTGIARLNATDKDGPENRGPFKFSLLDQKEGWLKSVRFFQHTLICSAYAMINKIKDESPGYPAQFQFFSCLGLHRATGILRFNWYPTIKVTSLWPYCRPHKLCTWLIYTPNERGHLGFFKTDIIFILPCESKKL